MSQRLNQGGRVDRKRPIRFTFNGKPYTGYQGDTLASALLANGVSMVARSWKYHRPRGILGSGVEEPNALVQLFEGNRLVPNARMTEVELVDGLVAKSIHAKPSIDFDLGAVNGWMSRFIPAGFYYKTFMASQEAWHYFEKRIRAVSGLGESPTELDPAKYDKQYAHCDVLVVGGGIAGLSAALAAGETGARVILCDEQAELGGWLLSSDAQIDGKPASEWVAQTLKRLEAMPEVRVLRRTTANGFHDHHYVSLVERRADHLVPEQQPVFRERLWRVRAREVILATGAHERPLTFANNDLPGIMLASAVSTYVRRYGVLPGRNAVVFTNNDHGYDAALALKSAGASVQLFDARAETRGTLPQRVKAAGIAVTMSSVITEASGGKRVSSVKVQGLDASGGLTGSARSVSCDLVAMSGGPNPVIHLHSQAGNKAAWNEQLQAFTPGKPSRASAGPAPAAASRACWPAPATAWKWVRPRRRRLASRTARSPCRQWRKSASIRSARSGWCRTPSARAAPPSSSSTSRTTSRLRHPAGGARRLRVDRARQALHCDGLRHRPGQDRQHQRHGHRRPDLGKAIPQVGTTTFRPNYTPVTFGVLAGLELGDAFDPVRTTAIHPWHVQHGALFEDVGQWKRPWYYPRNGEDMHAAVKREVLAARNGVGTLDASTLGKIDIQGPDAATFLNWSTATPGASSSGQVPLRLMLDENGMVFDDGVTVRLGENHFLMHTTTGGAARVHGLAGALAADRVAAPQGLPDLGHRPLGHHRRGGPEEPRPCCRRCAGRRLRRPAPSPS
jgi:sarcosine oxidase, subunit alpha